MLPCQYIKMRVEEQERERQVICLNFINAGKVLCVLVAAAG